MTMVAICRFPDGAVIITDSRATWEGSRPLVFQDTLQKLLPLAPKIVLAYAGDVTAAAIIAQQLRSCMKARVPSRLVQKLAAELPRVARHYYALFCARRRCANPLVLILGGVTEGGKIALAWFEAPHFHRHDLHTGFVVKGTGAVVEEYLRRDFERLSVEPSDLKARADALLIGLDAELAQHGIPTVGGLFQVVLLEPGGIRPLRYGFINLNPLNPARALGMEMEAGRWRQIDLTERRAVSLQEPAALLHAGPQALRVYDFQLPPGGPEPPGWHLTYFITCVAARVDTGTLECREVLTGIGSKSFPVLVRMLAAVGFWGSIGSPKLAFHLEQGAERQEIQQQHVPVEFLGEQVDVLTELVFTVNHAGPAFLECSLDGVPSRATRSTIPMSSPERYTLRLSRQA